MHVNLYTIRSTHSSSFLATPTYSITKRPLSHILSPISSIASPASFLPISISSLKMALVMFLTTLCISLIYFSATHSLHIPYILLRHPLPLPHRHLIIDIQHQPPLLHPINHNLNPGLVQHPRQVQRTIPFDANLLLPGKLAPSGTIRQRGRRTRPQSHVRRRGRIGPQRSQDVRRVSDRRSISATEQLSPADPRP